MKVKSLSTCSFLFLFLIGISNEGLAQPMSCSTNHQPSSVLKLCDSSDSSFGRPSGINTGCPDTTISVIFESDCSSAMISLSAYCVNLGQPDDVNKKFIPWPSYLEPFHLQYTYNDNTNTSAPLSNWSFIREYTVPHGGPTYNVFGSNLLIPLDEFIQQDCQLNPNDQTLFSISVNIVTLDNDDNWVAYPISKYSGIGNIFSCDVFTESCTGSDPTYELTICSDCADCMSIPFEPENNRMSTNIPSNSLSISPNPFSNSLRYKYFSKTDAQISVQLFSVDGSTIIQENKSAGIGENQYILDTSRLPNGTYFFQIIDGNKKTIERLVKIN